MESPANSALPVLSLSLHAGQESAAEHKRHLEEMHALQMKLHGQSDAAFSKFKQAAQVSLVRAARPGPARPSSWNP